MICRSKLIVSDQYLFAMSKFFVEQDSCCGRSWPTQRCTCRSLRARKLLRNRWADSMRRVSFLHVLMFLAACSCREQLDSGFSTRNTVEVTSPAGWCTASVVETTYEHPSSQVTQVLLSFDGGACGSGAASSTGTGLGLQLRWLDDTTLEVRHPASTPMTRNASGDVLQCRSRRVRVVLIPVT